MSPCKHKGSPRSVGWNYQLSQHQDPKFFWDVYLPKFWFSTILSEVVPELFQLCQVIVINWKKWRGLDECEKRLEKCEELIKNGATPVGFWVDKDLNISAMSTWKASPEETGQRKFYKNHQSLWWWFATFGSRSFSPGTSIQVISFAPLVPGLLRVFINLTLAVFFFE